MPAPTSNAPAARSWRLNVRALIILAVLVAVGVGGVVTAWALQFSGRRPRLLTEARRLAHDGKNDLALSYLKEYLANSPDDLDALDLRGEILSKSAHTPEQLQEVIRNGQKILRIPTAGDAERGRERGQEVRRRLVETILALGPMVPSSERKYLTAEGYARDLVFTPEDAKRVAEAEARGEELAAPPRPDATAADLRLYARALERSGSEGGNRQGKFVRAAAQLEEARKKDPGDIAGADLLARIYQSRLNTPEKAAPVLDDLLKAAPSAKAYLAVAKFYADVAADAGSSGRPAEVGPARQKSEEMVNLGVKAAPDDLDVRLAAAEVALANKKPAAAAEHLDRVAEADRQNVRYRTLRGIVELYENKADDALESWSSGLMISGGGSDELSWRLAFVLLQLGRVSDAEPLIQQYRRLRGGDQPPAEARFLEALRLLKTNRPRGALAELEKSSLNVSPLLKAQYYYTMGQCCEATRDEAGALDAFGKAIEADPKFSSPRLARARLLQASKPGAAIEELRLGLEQAGEDVPMLASLARLELAEQRALPPARRSWAALDDLLERGRRVAPGAPSLNIVRAEALIAQGKPEEAVDLLARATATGNARTDPDLWAARAQALVGLGRMDEALMVVDQGMGPKAAGDQASLRVLRARLLTSQGHGGEARHGLIQDLDRVRADQRPLIWMALGELYKAQNDLKGALKAFAEWARLLPDDPMPNLYVMEMILADPSADPDIDTAPYREALRRIGGHYHYVAEAIYELRDTSRDKDKKETPGDREARQGRAQEAIKKVVELAPKQRYAYLLRGVLMQQEGKPADAAAEYEKALKTEGGLVALPRLLAIYGELKSDADIQRLAQKYPAAAASISRRGAELLAARGDKAKAEELARQVVSGAPDSLDVRLWQARLLNTLGKPESAEKALRELAEKSPENYEPWLALAYFQVGRKDNKAAVATIEEMIGKAKNVERPELVWAQAWRVAGENDRADKAFAAALDRWPDDPRVGRGAADYYAATGRPDLAKKVLRDALGRDEAQRWAARGLALLLSGQHGDVKAWREAWDLVKDPAPGGDLPEDRLARALVLARGAEAGHRDEAARMLAGLVDDLPGDVPAAATARGVLARLLLKSEPARAADYAAADAAAADAPPAALTLHAEALIAAGKYDDADRQLDRLALLAPQDASAVTLRARLLRARGRGGEAVEHLERDAPAKIAGPDGEAAGRLIVQVLMAELGDPAAAERVARLLKEKFPKTAGVLAAVEAAGGKRDDALKHYLEVIQGGDPDAIREAARNSLALITRDKYDPATIKLAEEVIDAARKRETAQSPDLLAMAGYLRHFQNRFEEEIDIYRQALEKRPEDVSLMNNMAWTLSEGLKRPEEALERIDDAIRRSVLVPPQFYDTKGVILTRLGRYDDAINVLKIAVGERPTGATWAHLASAYHKANRMDDFGAARDAARKAGLRPDMLESSERAEIESLIFGKE